MELKERGPFSAFLVLLALQLLIPLTIVILLASFIKTLFFRYKVKKPPYKDTILLTGGKMTKSLQLARLLSKAGYRIILTGGYAKLFKRYIKNKTTIDQNITIKGIASIFKKII